MKLTELAERIDGTLDRTDDREITGIAGLDEAHPGDITFMTNPKFASALEKSEASAVVVGRKWEGRSPCPVVRVGNPDKAMALCAALLGPGPSSSRSGGEKAAGMPVLLMR